MNDDYLLRPLGELGVLDRGRSRHRPRYAPHLYGGEYPFIQTGDIKSSGGKITTFTQAYSEAGLAQSRLWNSGTLCITIAANIAETAILTFPSCFPDSVVGFIGNPDLVDTRYVEYTFRHLRSRIQGDASGSVQDNINLEYLRSHQIPVYSLATQKAIAHILGTLDDKIELNRKTNETLEAMAKALFKSWFVDFDPIRAKAEGRPTGLPAEISDLFPYSFEDSEFGEIPSGWDVAEIAHIVNLKKDSIDPSFTPEETFDHYSIPAFDAGKNPAKELGSSIKSQKFLVDEGDLLVSKLNPSTPRVWIPFSSSARRSICSTEFLVCRASIDVGRAFAYCLASSDSIIEVMTGLAGGTSNSHQRIRPGDFLALDCCIGSQKVRSAFSDVVEPLLRKTLAQRIESRSLASARDALLPKLISGEIRIPDAEKMLEEVGV